MFHKSYTYHIYANNFCAVDVCYQKDIVLLLKCQRLFLRLAKWQRAHSLLLGVTGSLDKSNVVKIQSMLLGQRVSDSIFIGHLETSSSDSLLGITVNITSCRSNKLWNWPPYLKIAILFSKTYLILNTFRKNKVISWFVRSCKTYDIREPMHVF